METINIDDYTKVFNESLEKLKNTITDNEQIVYTFGVGRVIPSPLMPRKLKREMKKAMDAIRSFDGFIGVHPVDVWRNLLIFDSYNNAKRGKNRLMAENVQTGEIMPIAIPKVAADEN